MRVEAKTERNRDLIENIRIDLERQTTRLGVIVGVASIIAVAISTAVARWIVP